MIFYLPFNQIFPMHELVDFWLCENSRRGPEAGDSWWSQRKKRNVPDLPSGQTVKQMTRSINGEYVIS